MFPTQYKFRYMFMSQALKCDKLSFSVFSTMIWVGERKPIHFFKSPLGQNLQFCGSSKFMV